MNKLNDSSFIKKAPVRQTPRAFELVSFDLFAEPVTTPRSEKRTSCLSHIQSRQDNKKFSRLLFLASVVAQKEAMTDADLSPNRPARRATRSGL
jgi:hypothetical protein